MNGFMSGLTKIGSMVTRTISTNASTVVQSSVDTSRVEFGSVAWFDARWNSLSPDFQKKAAAAVKAVIKGEDLVLIRAKHAKYGPHEWIHHLIDVEPGDDSWGPSDGTLSGHHIWGTAIRNALRHAGLKDEDLPPVEYRGGQSYQNWDDYYVGAIEAAAGLR